MGLLFILFSKSITNVVLSSTAKQLQQLRENGVKLDRYLWSRHVPMEDRDIIHKKNQIKKELLKRAGASRVSDLGNFDFD